MTPQLQCAEQQVSPSNLTKYCACHAEWLTYLVLITYETSFTMRGATGVTIQPHQILRLSRRKTHILSPHHSTAPATKSDTWTSPSTAPARKSDTWTSPSTACHCTVTELYCTLRLYSTLLYSTLLYLTLLYVTLLYLTLLYLTLLYLTLLYLTLLYLTLLYLTLLYLTLLYLTLLYLTLLYLTLLYLTLLYLTLLYLTLLYLTLLYLTLLYLTLLYLTLLYLTLLYLTLLYLTLLYLTLLYLTLLYLTLVYNMKPHLQCAEQLVSPSNLTTNCACHANGSSSSQIKPHLQCAKQLVSPSNLTTNCACQTKRLTFGILITYETSFPMRRATGVTIKTHQILRLSRRKTHILSPHHIWNLIARSNWCHHQTSPNTAPVTQKDSHSESSSHMKPHFQCAEQQVSLSNLTKYCASSRKMTLQDLKKISKNMWNIISNAGTIRAWSDHDPSMKTQTATRLVTEVTFRAHHEHFLLKNTTFRAQSYI